jgi:hypothetical protein
MPTSLPERPRPGSQDQEAVPVAFLLGTFAVAVTAIALSAALLGPVSPAAVPGRAEPKVAIGFAP